MKTIVQRVSSASVSVSNEIVGKINKGFLLLVGFCKGDDKSKCEKMAKKISGLRIFDDNEGKMNLSLKDVCGDILSISQFTLYGNTNKGNRPSFVEALNQDEARILYSYFNDCLKSYGLKVEQGVFQADMEVALVNDGPITIIVEQ